jgi:hypothetical protein
VLIYVFLTVFRSSHAGHFQGPTQSTGSRGRTGIIVGATSGAIAFVIAAALAAALCRRRHLKRVRRQTILDPFVDLDGEMVAVNQPLIIGDGPDTAGVVYSDPYEDDSWPRTQTRSLSLTTGTGIMLGESNNTSRAVVGTDPSPTSDLTSGLTAEHHDQHRPADRLSPTGNERSRSHQSLPQVQTQFPPEFPVPRRSSPTFDAGALAYIPHNSQTADRNLPSPGHYSPGNAEDLRLTSAFSVASELSPRHSAHLPPLNIDETWRSSPDPIKTSSSYRPPSFSRRRSFTPSISGLEPGDTAEVASPDPLTQDPAQDPPSPPSEYSASPHTIRSGTFASRLSPMTEVVEMLSHSQEGSSGSGTWISTQSGDTSKSLPVVMTAERVQLTRGPVSLSLTLPAYTTSLGPSTSGRYGETLPPTEATNNFPQMPPPLGGSLPLPQLPQVQPLALGKKRSTQGPI